MASLNNAEVVADDFIRGSRKYLPTLGRLLLVATFIEDGLRMWFQWNDQAGYFRRQWGAGTVLVTLFLTYNMIAQIGASAMVVARKHVEVAVGILFSVVVLQAIAYSVLWNFNYFLRNLALTGGLILLLAEVRGPGRIVFAGVPVAETQQERQKNVLVLLGRVLCLLMFFTLIHGEMSPLRVVFSVIGSALIVLVFIGYKTKLSALSLVVFLATLNMFLNSWWMMPLWNPQRDFAKYDFFQTLSVVGGLLLLVYLGPGGMSVDERKKRF
eukprot:Opistho-2@21557